jgi:hypothetical protein
VLPEPGGREPQARDGAEQRGRRDGVLRHDVAAGGVDDVERDQVQPAGAAAQHTGRAVVLRRPDRRGGHEVPQDGVLGGIAVGDRPALLQCPALGTDDVALVGEDLLDLAAGPGAEEGAAGALLGGLRRTRRRCPRRVDVGLPVGVRGRGHVPVR